MPKFTYKAKKNPRKIVEGTIPADNRNSAIQKLSGMGLFVISIDEYAMSKSTPGKARGLFRARVSLKDVTNFTRQLSDLLESGLAIVKALDILRGQTENRKLKEIISDIRDSCMDGNPLSSALERHPGVFSNLFVNMVRSGETGGTIEDVFRRLSEFSDKQLEIRTKVRSALAYPILMAIVGGATIVVLFTFVIPRMMGMFGDLGQNLPLPTLILIGINTFLRKYWWLIASAILTLVFFVSRAYKSREGRLVIDKYKLNMPIFGSLIKKIEIARFARTLATLLSNGVPVLSSLSIVAETANNSVIKEEIAKAASSVREGSNIAGSLSGSAHFPPVVTNMIAVGEEGGHVEKALFKVAATFERETDSAIKIMLSLLEPVLILVLGVIVGFIVIAMLLPIFEINFLAK